MITQYMADAFTDRLFSGNQVAVCILPEFPKDALMQNIAVENNLSETAFVVKTADRYNLRWFTPGGEIDLCGHATLGTAFVLMTQVAPTHKKIEFSTKSGLLTVEYSGNLYHMNFPQMEFHEISVTEQMIEAIGVTPKEAYLGRDLMLVLESEEDVVNMQPQGDLLKKLPGLLQAVTAHGVTSDCVSRIFAPKLDILEDPVTGSTHCMIAPYWWNKLSKDRIKAYQASKRGGMLICSNIGNDRIDISGNCVLYSKSELYI